MAPQAVLQYSRQLNFVSIGSSPQLCRLPRCTVRTIPYIFIHRYIEMYIFDCDILERSITYSMCSTLCTVIQSTNMNYIQVSCYKPIIAILKPQIAIKSSTYYIYQMMGIQTSIVIQYISTTLFTTIVGFRLHGKKKFTSDKLNVHCCSLLPSFSRCLPGQQYGNGSSCTKGHLFLVNHFIDNRQFVHFMQKKRLFVEIFQQNYVFSK